MTSIKNQIRVKQLGLSVRDCFGWSHKPVPTNFIKTSAILTAGRLKKKIMLVYTYVGVHIINFTYFSMAVNILKTFIEQNLFGKWWHIVILVLFSIYLTAASCQPSRIPKLYRYRPNISVRYRAPWKLSGWFSYVEMVWFGFKKSETELCFGFPHTPIE
jgi:hypothetical protein